MSVYKDYVQATVSNRKGSLLGRCFFGLRDLSPQSDIEEEKILRSHCSARWAENGLLMCSMLSECHPSVASGVSIAYKYSGVKRKEVMCRYGG